MIGLLFRNAINWRGCWTVDRWYDDILAPPLWEPT